MAAQFAAQQAADRAAARVAAERIAAQNAAEEAQQVADQVALRAAQHAAEVSARRAAEAAAHRIPEPAAQPVAPRFTPPVQPTWQPAASSGEMGDSPLFNSSQPPFYPQPYDYSMFATPEAPLSAAPVPQAAQPHREATEAPSSAAWSQPEQREPNGRPAWLMNDRAEGSSQAPVAATVPQAPEDTLQGSRERMASRWFALRSVFEAAPPTPETVREPVVARAPALAVFSLAGGVGKTSLVATLGRALSARGERVLLVDTAAFGLLPFFFGARDQRPGMLRTFSPPGVSTDAPIQMVTLDPEGLGPEAPGHENLTAEISKYSRGVSRVIVDLATASGATTRRILRMQPLILVPVVPDMSSVVSVSSIDAFFDRNGNPGGKASLPYYILNQFDPSLPLNLDVREVLREQLGDRLLPFALRRAPAINEALAEGMTVMDYAPNSALAEDFGTLATWVKSLSAPATTTYRGVRWSER
jgi:cellulose synthase operon protein YhjQ